MAKKGKEIKLCDLKDLERCAGELSDEILSAPPSDRATTILLSGELGSGKTAFVKALAASLGVKENVLSPTFVIEKIYKLPPGKNFRHLIHIDAYRLEDKEELISLGFEELSSSPENIIVVEWPEKTKGLFPKNAKELKFKFVDEKTREISFQ